MSSAPLSSVVRLSGLPGADAGADANAGGGADLDSWVRDCLAQVDEGIKSNQGEGGDHNKRITTHYWLIQWGMMKLALYVK